MFLVNKISCFLYLNPVTWVLWRRLLRIRATGRNARCTSFVGSLGSASAAMHTLDSDECAQYTEPSICPSSLFRPSPPYSCASARNTYSHNSICQSIFLSPSCSSTISIGCPTGWETFMFYRNTSFFLRVAALQCSVILDGGLWLRSKSPRKKWSDFTDTDGYILVLFLRN